jgi:hypothetical protein
MTHERNDGKIHLKDVECIIPLSRGMTTVVDNDDYTYLSQFKWYAHSQRGLFYACRNVPDPTKKSRQRCESMARVICHLSNSDTRVVDHINHDTMDNRKLNLRVCSQRANMHNIFHKFKNKTSKYVGVNLMSDRPKFRAELTVFGKNFHLGIFENEDDAYAAYCGAVKSNENIIAMTTLEEYYAST